MVDFQDTVPDPARERSVPARPGAAIDCPQCRAPMRHLVLPGHHAPATVDVDHCGPCGLVWFDARESVQLSGLAWIRLLRELHHHHRPDPPHQERRACPLCRVPLKQVSNLSRFGRFPALECVACGGHLHSQAGMLAERGLIRPLLPAERGALMAEKRQLLCLNCGGPSDGKGEHCAWCKSPLLMIDLPRLAHALRMRSPTEPLLAPSGGRPLAWACRGCGAPMNPGKDTRCGQCHHTLVVPSMADLEPLLDSLERDWRDAEALYGGERQARLAAQYKQESQARRGEWPSFSRDDEDDRWLPWPLDWLIITALRAIGLHVDDDAFRRGSDVEWPTRLALFLLVLAVMTVVIFVLA
ncbi:hypothetical protein CDN99_04480 [Roseateles aquatilis]|uniref:Uncharacterized protein n=2 Tax=Roseateles aquatilis TaxID=431061 RepID=A0A246JMH4_9BURK|nr:hypothetical protein CDN99_04480 [Roseateles aquatilis]